MCTESENWALEEKMYFHLLQEAFPVFFSLQIPMALLNYFYAYDHPV